MKRANTTNKKQFLEQLATRMGSGTYEAERWLNGIISLIYSDLKDGTKVNISGFGAFSVSRRAARLGVNPRDPSVKITIPELNTPKFKAGEAFKEAIKLRKE